MSEVNPRTVVVLVAGSAVVVDPWVDLPPAIVVSWYAGMEGGDALADILLRHGGARRAASLRRPAPRSPTCRPSIARRPR